MTTATAEPPTRQETGTEILALINGPPSHIMVPRARELFGPSARIVCKEHGRFRSAPAVWKALKAQTSGWIYVLDMGFPIAPLAALRRKLSKNVRLAIDTGDVSKPLLANQGRSGLEVFVAHQLDRHIPQAADLTIFRSTFAAPYFEQIAPGGRLPRWTWLPDGADCTIFRPRRDEPEIAELRRRHGLEGQFVVGIVGSIHHNARLNLFYGWELAGALARLPRELPVTGVVVGDGPGRAVLEAERDRLGLGDRLKLVGRVPHDQVPLWINVFDVALSTQTNDPVGWSRTTAKVPEYLACGTAILSTDVGEAHRWLTPSGQTLPYEGMRDESYPDRLAARIRELLDSDLTPLREHNRALALRVFSYDVLRARIRAELDAAARGIPGPPPPEPPAAAGPSS